MSDSAQAQSDMLQAIEELRLTSKRSVPWTLAAAILTIAAFAFAIWTVWSMQQQIGELTTKTTSLEQAVATSEQRNQALTGTLRSIYARPSLDATTRQMVGNAIGEAREASVQLEQVAASAAATAEAVTQIAVNQPTEANASPATTVVSVGTATGWDVDIFWCDDVSAPATAERNRARAESDARRLSSQNPWPNGMTVGRVRVRPLATRLQGRGYPVGGSGVQIRPDADRQEQSAARAIVELLGGDPSYSITGSRMATRLYISLFVCT